MEYLSTRAIPSQQAPGVIITIRKMTWARRAELEELQAAATERMRAVQEKMAPLSKEYSAAVAAAKALVQPKRDELEAGGMSVEEASKAAPLGPLGFPDEKFRELVGYSDQVRKIDVEELTPIAVRYAFVEFTGLTIDGEPATLEMVRHLGPDSLYAEVAELVKHEIELSTEERENLLSPSTSAAAVDGEKTRGTAGLVVMPAMTMTVDARSSTDPDDAVVINTSVAR